MKRALIPLAAAGLLAGCAGYEMDPTRAQAIRSVFEQQLMAWNAAGVDPLQLAPEKQIYALLACGTLSSIGTVVNPTAPTLSEELGKWCATLAQAAAPAG